MSASALSTAAFNTPTTNVTQSTSSGNQASGLYYNSNLAAAHTQPPPLSNPTAAHQQLLLNQLLEQLNNNNNSNNSNNNNHLNNLNSNANVNFNNSLNANNATLSNPAPASDPQPSLDANAYLQAFFSSQLQAPPQPTPQPQLPQLPPQLPSLAQLEQLILWKQFEQQLAQQLLNNQQQQSATQQQIANLFQTQPPSNNNQYALPSSSSAAIKAEPLLQPTISTSNNVGAATQLSLEDAVAQAVQATMQQQQQQQQQSALEQALQQQLNSNNNGAMPQLPPLSQLSPADLQILLSMSPSLLNSLPQPATVLAQSQYNNRQPTIAQSIPTPANVLQSNNIPHQSVNPSHDPSVTSSTSDAAALTTKRSKKSPSSSSTSKRGKFYDKMNDEEKAAFRAKMSATVTGLWQKPEYRSRLVARYREAHNTPTARQNHSRALKEIAQRPEHREAALARMAAYRAAPEFKESSKRGQQASAMIRSAKAQYRREAASKYFQDGLCQLCTVAGRSGLKQLNNPEQQFHHLKGTVAHHAEYKLICDQAEESVLEKKEEMHQRTLERKREARHHKQTEKKLRAAASGGDSGMTPSSMASTETSTINSHDNGHDSLSPSSTLQGMTPQLPLSDAAHISSSSAQPHTTSDVTNPIDAINDTASHLPFGPLFNPAPYNFTMPMPQTTASGAPDFSQLMLQYTQ